MAPGFDAARDHRFAATRWFEDFALGERFYIPSRTQTDALFAAFQLASGDNDPIHYDVESVGAAVIRACWRTACRS